MAPQAAGAAKGTPMRRVDRSRRLIALLLALLLVSSTALIAPPPAGAAESERSGLLNVVHGDPRPGSGDAPMTLYTLWEGGDRHTRLDIPRHVIASAGGELALRQQSVTVRGTSRGDARFDVSSITLEQPDSVDGPFAATASTSAVSGSQKWVTIPCQFADYPGGPPAKSPPQPATWFQPLVGSGSTSYPGLNHYWREVSYNQINIDGSTVITNWHTLPQTRAYYLSFQSNPGLMLTNLGVDCATAAGGASAVSGYMGVNFMYDDDLDCCAWGGSMTLFGTGYKATWMPVWGWSNQMILAHEMGHGFGLPHSSGPYSEVYDSHWDVMSRGGSCSSPHAQYGCVAVHTISYHKDLLGWIAAGNKTTVTPSATPATFNLAPLGQPAPGGSLHMIRIPIGGSNTLFYTVEARRFTGYDSQIPGEAVILHRVDTNSNESPARVVDVDNNGNPNDAGAMWTPGETFGPDIEVVSVTSPSSVEQGQTVTISAQIQTIDGIVVEVSSFNGSTYQVTVRCEYCSTSDMVSVRIQQTPSGHSETKSVSVGSGVANFDWTTTVQTPLGNHTFVVSADVPNDRNQSNNSKSRTIRVDAPPVHDAAVISLTGPPSIVQGQSAILSAEIKNNGTVSDTISVSISKNPLGFSQTQSVTLNAGQEQTVTFNWSTTEQTATGNHTFTVTASVSGDTNTGNDSKTHTIRVDAPGEPPVDPPPATIDAEVTSLNGPASVTQGNAATLTAQVRNNGTTSATIEVGISTNSAGFSESQTVTLGPGDTQTVTFTWQTTAQTATGNHTFTVTAILAGDTNAGNNSKTHTVRVDAPVAIDAEVVSVSAPGSVTQGQAATIAAEVRNNGSSNASIAVTLSKSPAGFSDTRQVTLGAGASQVVTFTWQTSEQTTIGNHVITVTAELSGDANPGNDAKSVTVRIDSPGNPPPPPPPAGMVTVELTALCYQIDAAGALVSDRCEDASLAGQHGETSDGYRYTFGGVAAPASAPLVLYPTNGDACQVDVLAVPVEEDGVLTLGQPRICTTWDGQQIISQVPSYGPIWSRADLAVASGMVARTWLWGPTAISGFMAEPYQESSGIATPLGWRGLTAYSEAAWSGGYRLVIYLDKTRMEITHPDAVDDGLWYVTNGLLVVELTTGRLQLGDDTFEQRTPATVNVAGDSDDPSGPTYATFGLLRDAPALPDGSTIVQRVSRDGTVSDDQSLAAYGVTATHRVSVPGLDHQVASVFWEYMHASGVVYANGAYAVEPLFVNPFYATGLPISEAYWARVKVAGTYKDVLMQCFERRCLTWTPDNPDGWQVEAGNVGLHYYAWRYDAS